MSVESSKVVVPFFRGPAVLGENERRLFQKDLPQGKFLELLKGASLQTRQNIQRIMIATLIASQEDRTLLFRAGWKGAEVKPNPVREQKNRMKEERKEDHPKEQKFLTESQVQYLLLRLLERRGIVTRPARVMREDVSRLTLEEVPALEEAQDVIGIAGDMCPSAFRANMYIREVHGEKGKAHHPSEGFLHLNDEQSDLLKAVRPTLTERVKGGMEECVNFSLHIFSRFLQKVYPQGRPLEQRLAHTLRPDRAPHVPRRVLREENTVTWLNRPSENREESP